MRKGTEEEIHQASKNLYELVQSQVGKSVHVIVDDWIRLTATDNKPLILAKAKHLKGTDAEGWMIGDLIQKILK
jgi:hypothetical protein